MTAVRLQAVVPVGGNLAVVCHFNRPGRLTKRAKKPVSSQFVFSFIDTKESDQSDQWSQKGKSLRLTVQSCTKQEGVNRLAAWLKEKKISYSYPMVVKTALELAHQGMLTK